MHRIAFSAGHSVAFSAVFAKAACYIRYWEMSGKHCCASIQDVCECQARCRIAALGIDAVKLTDVRKLNFYELLEDKRRRTRSSDIKIKPGIRMNLQHYVSWFCVLSI